MKKRELCLKRGEKCALELLPELPQPMTFDLARRLRCESDLTQTKRTCIYILL